MSFPCDQCGTNLDTEEDYEECGMCGDDVCYSCLNGQYNCEACLKEEEGEEDE